MTTLYKRPKVFIILLAIGVSFGMLLPGCSDDDNIGTIDDILPNVSLSAPSLDFGTVTVETSSIKAITINNLTNGNVTIERVTSTNAVFLVGGYNTGGELVELELPFTIERNGARAIFVGFYPDEAQEYIGKLVVESSIAGSELETDLVDLKGVGLPDPN